MSVYNKLKYLSLGSLYSLV